MIPCTVCKAKPKLGRTEDFQCYYYCGSCGLRGANAPSKEQAGPHWDDAVKQRFADRMRKCAENEDYESAHGEADDILLDTLEALGFKEGVEICREASKGWHCA